MSASVGIRPATASDRADLRRAVVQLQEHERALHDSRRPGEEIADVYLAWLEEKTAKTGVTLIAEVDGAFAGFVAAWIEESGAIAETPDSNRFAYVSDIFVAPQFRGRRIAAQLLNAIESHLRREGLRRMRLAGLAANTAAARAYERAGFSAYEIIYERPIGRPNDDA